MNLLPLKFWRYCLDLDFDISKHNELMDSSSLMSSLTTTKKLVT